MKYDEPGWRENENGNGSFMWILPLAFISILTEEIIQVSDLTHAHWISENACGINVDPATELIKEKADIIPVLKQAAAFNHLQKAEICSDGYVGNTLEAAFWCLRCPAAEQSFHPDVLRAVNLGYDTDTTTAATGGLASIR